MIDSNKPSTRGLHWLAFEPKVFAHIENYTVPQYGDFPNDQLTNWSLSDIKTTLLRYVNRIGSGARGKEEELRDMLKVAHYAQVAYDMINKREEEVNV